jgi:hypothetical protein
MRRGEYRWADNPSTEPFRTLRIGDPGTWEVVLTDGCWQLDHVEGPVW